MPFEIAAETTVSPRCCIWGYSKKTVKKTFKLRILRIIILIQQNIKVSMTVQHAVGICRLFIHLSVVVFSILFYALPGFLHWQATVLKMS